MSAEARDVVSINDVTTLVAFLLEEGAASPEAAAAGLKRMSELSPDPSPESLAQITEFISAGGAAAVVKTMRTHCPRDEVDDPVQGRAKTAALSEVQEQGCVLLMSLAGAALSGDAACSRALVDAGAADAVVRAVETFPGTLAADNGESGIAALMQLSTLDLQTALAAGAASVVTRSMQASQAGGWLLFLCARTLSWAFSTGGTGELRDG
jgi:hypothetical protein